MDRRQFLKTIALGAGAALVPSTVFAFDLPFDPGFEGKRFSLVWQGDNYHCYYTDKTFVVAHKAKGFLPPPKDLLDPTYQILKKSAFERLKDKDRIIVQKKKLLEMIEKSGNGKTPDQNLLDNGDILDSHFGDITADDHGTHLDRVILAVNRYNRNPDNNLYSNIRRFYSKQHKNWVGVDIDNIRMMLKSAPDTILMTFDDKVLSFVSQDGSWVSFLATLIGYDNV